MKTLYVGMFVHLKETVLCRTFDKEKMTPREYRLKAYKYCSAQIHGILGWH
jgi:hypothetical protein